MGGLIDKFGPIRKGLLGYLVLKIIASEKMYVADLIERLGETEFETQEGTLYPLLNKMQRDGILDYEWKESVSGPPRKYYRLTSKGRSELKELDAYWADINATIKTIGITKTKS